MSTATSERGARGRTGRGGSGRRAASKREKLERIRAAVLALLGEKGFEATTTREVAERADIATGTLFLYAKTKEELLDLVFREEVSSVLARAQTSLPARGDVIDRLHHLFAPLVDFYARQPAVSRMLLRQVLLQTQSPTVQLTFDFVTKLAVVIEEAQARDEIVDDPPALELAAQAFTLYIGAVLSVANEMERAVEAKARLHFALRIHFLGLRGQGGSHGRLRSQPRRQPGRRS